MVERYILTKGMHLGYLKETFGRGSVLTYDEEKRVLDIDGRKFQDVRDMEILKRQAAKNPVAPWVVPYSPQVLAEMREGRSEAVPAVEKRAKPSDGMKVVHSDQDVLESIDIRNTQVGKRNAEKKAASRQQVRDEGMEVIQGDETVEERIARLKDSKNTDMAARAERVRLMRERKAKMPIVHDDSLGSAVGGKASSMNAGMPVGGRRAEEAPEEVRQRAEERRREAEQRRLAAVHEEVGNVGEDIELGVGPEDANPPALKIDPRDAEIAALREQLESLKSIPADQSVPPSPVSVDDIPKNPVLEEEKVARPRKVRKMGKREKKARAGE